MDELWNFLLSYMCVKESVRSFLNWGGLNVYVFVKCWEIRVTLSYDPLGRFVGYFDYIPLYKKKKVLGYVKVSLFFSIFLSNDHLLFVFVILFTIISDMSRSATITAFHIVDFIQFVFFFFSFLSFFLFFMLIIFSCPFSFLLIWFILFSFSIKKLTFQEKNWKSYVIKGKKIFPHFWTVILKRRRRKNSSVFSSFLRFLKKENDVKNFSSHTLTLTSIVSFSLGTLIFFFPLKLTKKKI